MPVFPHRFGDDLRAIDWFGEPFALARFGDGELACIQGIPYNPYGSMMGTETWRSELGVPLRDQLQASLECDADGYYVGVSPICCQGGGTVPYVKAPWERRVPSTIFSYGNHALFHKIARKLDLRKRSVLVSGRGGDIEVPLNAINRDDWLEPLMDKLLRVRDKPILVAAGPAACIIVHQYWLRAYVTHPRTTIVDIGSVLDIDLWGRGTRMHTAGPDPRGMRFHQCILHGREPCHPGCNPSRF